MQQVYVLISLYIMKGSMYFRAVCTYQPFFISMREYHPWLVSLTFYTLSMDTVMYQNHIRYMIIDSLGQSLSEIHIECKT